MLGEDGALESLAAGAAWIDMTSNSPAAVRPVQERAMEQLWFGQAVATAEALLLGQRAGIDLAVLQRTLADSSAASTFICRDIGSVFRGDYLASFGLDRICDELEAVTALAGEYQVPWELSDVVRQTYYRALARFGPADGELLAVALLEDEAGLKLRTGRS